MQLDMALHNCINKKSHRKCHFTVWGFYLTHILTPGEHYAPACYGQRWNLLSLGHEVLHGVQPTPPLQGRHSLVSQTQNLHCNFLSLMLIFALPRETLQLQTLHYIIQLIANYYETMTMEKRSLADARQWAQRSAVNGSIVQKLQLLPYLI